MTRTEAAREERIRKHGALRAALDANARLQARVEQLEMLAARRAAPPPPPPGATMARLVALAAAEFGIAADLILGPSRHAEVVLARHVVISIARRQLRYSAPRIGRLMGRHHSSVLHAEARIAALAAADPALAARIETLAARLSTPQTGGMS